MILVDSNLIIYAASGKHPKLVDWFEVNQPVASAISDALIAATALHYDLTLATHNVEDFEWIDALTVIDPLAE